VERERRSYGVVAELLLPLAVVLVDSDAGVERFAGGLALQLGQLRALQLKATSSPKPQLGQRTLAKPRARMPQSR
jgi:hypothetical protein